MAKINQIGPGRRTIGAVDGVTYVTRKGKTFARANPIMPAKVFQTPAALKRQAIFKMVQMHLKYHLRTLKQTFTPKGAGSPANRYYSRNGKYFTKALDTLAELWVAGEVVTLTNVEEAICAYAAEHQEAIVIASLSGYGEVFLTGEWPDTITLHANGGHNTIIIFVAENGTTTTVNPDGTTVVTPAGESGGSGSSNGSGSGSGSNSGSGSDSGSGSETPSVAAPTISGTTPFEETTTVTISGPEQATVYYTTDGSTPTSSSTQYTEAFALSDTATVKAIAIKDGVSSSVATKTFTKGTGGDDLDQ
jgi:uncharacterized membrane protein YgcG